MKSKEDKNIKAKEIGKNKKIVILIIAGLCFIFITYNLFFGNITDKTHSVMIGTNYCTGKFRITNEEELKAFEAITYNIMDQYKSNLASNDIFVDITTSCACPQGIYVRSVKVNNFVSVNYSVINTTCAAVSRCGVLTVIPKDTLKHAYTGNWNNPLDVLNNLENKEYSILKGYYCSEN